MSPQYIRESAVNDASEEASLAGRATEFGFREGIEAAVCILRDEAKLQASYAVGHSEDKIIYRHAKNLLNVVADRISALKQKEKS